MEQNQQSKNEPENRPNEMEAEMEGACCLEAQMQPLAESRQQETTSCREQSQQLQDAQEHLVMQLSEEPQPQITETLASSSATDGSETSDTSEKQTNNVPAVADALKGKLTDAVRQQRKTIINKLQRRRQTMEVDRTARVLDNLSISGKVRKVRSHRPFYSASFHDRARTRFEVDEREFEYVSKSRQMQRLLSRVLHTQNCRPNQAGASNCPTCDSQVCSDTRVILDHMRTCTVVVNCPTPKCSLAREVFDHYQNCTTNDCSICLPARRESISTLEYLHHFINTIGKGVDEQVPMETPSAPSIVIPPNNALLNPDVTQTPSLPTIFPPGLSGGGLLQMPTTTTISFARRTEAQAQETSADMRMED